MTLYETGRKDGVVPALLFLLQLPPTSTLLGAVNVVVQKRLACKLWGQQQYRSGTNSAVPMPAVHDLVNKSPVAEVTHVINKQV